MKSLYNFGFWIFLFCIFNITLSQEVQDYMDSESAPPDYFELYDGLPLLLNRSYCLTQISAEVLPCRVYDQHNKSLYYIKINWDSEHFMTSIKVESDSWNDSYCEAENKHYYYRKPLNQSFHVFPDDVNEGIRFLPIKLDCKYLITPELEGLCRPLKLKYATPVCIDNETCSCRNVFIPAPNLEIEHGKDGVNVFWFFPKNLNDEVSRIILTIYFEDGINVKKISKQIISIRSYNIVSGIKHKHFFQVNDTSENDYRIQGYFENRISCQGNSTFLRFRYPKSSSNSRHEKIMSYLALIIFLMLLGLVALALFWKKRLKRLCMKNRELPGVRFGPKERQTKTLLPHMVSNPTYAEQCREPDVFDYRDLVIIREIASGNFGVVYLAYSSRTIKGCNEFAIKQIKGISCPEAQMDFDEEINMFQLVGSHPNVVKMLGYCRPPQPLTIVMEYVPYNLLLYLKNLRVQFEKRKMKTQTDDSINYSELSHSRNSSISSILDENYISQAEVESAPLGSESFRIRELDYVLDHRDLETFSLHIARGMAHLESRNIVHRDLAARNVLMDNFKNLKISDFGMSKTGIYVNKRTKKFPLRWMSPEALVHRTYSNKSDVWSFAVVLWEIGTLGAFPYPHLQNEEVISLLEKGGHLDRPDNITATLYDLMVECWAPLPEDRPDFKDLVYKIESFCQKSTGYVEFESLKCNYVFPPMEEEIQKTNSSEN